MSLRDTVEIEREDLLKHPAVQAWNQLRPGSAMPHAVETLKYKDKSAVYRLAGIEQNGSAVVAKRCGMATARLERAIYEEILPRLPVPALQFFGFVADDDARYGWLFIEDAGREFYSPALPEHRVALARWLAALHVAAAELLPGPQLPDRGCGYYRQQLRLALNNFVVHLDHFMPEKSELVLINEILMECTLLESHWDRLEEVCLTLPPTFVHGDLKEKNICAHRAAARWLLWPVDWEVAGWGTPAPDLFHCPDLNIYWQEARRCWPDLELDDLKKLAATGMIFRALAGICWDSQMFRYEWIKWHAANHLRPYRDWLAEAVRRLAIR